MKKIFFIIITLIMSISLCACTTENDETERELKMIMPSGTPSLALATYAYNASNEGKLNYEICSGSDPLIAAFTNANYDIIVAPVNLGAKMYQVYGKYALYKTIVWGNLYVASKNDISSLDDLNGKTITCFGKNSTPDIVLRSLLANRSDLDITVEYCSDVSEANTLLASGKAEYIVSAEPALTKLKAKLGLKIIDLQNEWEKMTGSSSYPQAGIFVKRSIAGSNYVKNALRQMSDSVLSTNNAPSDAADIAVKVHTSFETLGTETLTQSIPFCHFNVLESDKEAVNYYLQVMMDLGFGKQMGEKLPDEKFYL